MTEKFFPFLVGRDPIFLAGPECPPSGKERQVGLNGLVWVDGLIAECHFDVSVSCNNLRYVWG